MNEIFLQKPTPQELANMIADVDDDKSGKIEFNEFLKMMAKKNKGKDAELREAFNVFDKSKGGLPCSLLAPPPPFKVFKC